MRAISGLVLFPMEMTNMSHAITWLDPAFACGALLPPSSGSPSSMSTTSAPTSHHPTSSPISFTGLVSVLKTTPLLLGMADLPLRAGISSRPRRYTTVTWR